MNMMLHMTTNGKFDFEKTISNIKNGDFSNIWKDVKDGDIATIIVLFSALIVVVVLIWLISGLFGSSKIGDIIEEVTINGCLFEVRLEAENSIIRIYFGDDIMGSIDGRRNKDVYNQWMKGGNYARVFDMVNDYVDNKYKELMVDELYKFIFKQDLSLDAKLGVNNLDNKLDRILVLINLMKRQFEYLYVFLDHNSQATGEKSKIYNEIMGFESQIKSTYTYNNDNVRWEFVVYNSNFEHIFKPFCKASVLSKVTIDMENKNGLVLKVGDVVKFSKTYRVSEINEGVYSAGRPPRYNNSNRYAAVDRSINRKEDIFCFNNFMDDIFQEFNARNGDKMFILSTSSVGQDSSQMDDIKEFMTNLRGYGSILMDSIYKDQVQGKIKSFDEWFNRLSLIKADNNNSNADL